MKYYYREHTLGYEQVKAEGKTAWGEIRDDCDQPPYPEKEDRVAAGAMLRYELEVCNDGPSTAENVVLYDRLPPGIAYRKKQGYSFPIKNWLRGDLKGYMRDRLHSSSLIRENFNAPEVNRLMDEHLAMTHNHSHILWALICLSIWHDLFFGT